MNEEEELNEELRLDNYARVMSRLMSQDLFAKSGVFIVPKDKELSNGQLEDIQWLMDEYDYGFERE